MNNMERYENKPILIEDRLFNFVINKIRHTTAHKNKLISRSQFTKNPSDDQLYDFAISMASGKNENTYSNRSVYEILAKQMLDDVIQLSEFRKLITMIERDKYIVDNPFIKHELHLIEEHRYFFHIRRKPLNLIFVEDGCGNKVIREGASPPDGRGNFMGTILESLTSIACALCVTVIQRAQRIWQWPAELCGLRTRQPADEIVYRYAMNLALKNLKYTSSIWSANAVAIAKKVLDDSRKIDELRVVTQGIGFHDRIVLSRKLGK
jgi:hypothetical protein